MNGQKKITFDSFIRGVLGGVVFIAVLYLLNRLSGVLLPFFIAWIIAYLMYPMVKFYQDKLRIKNRALAIFLVMLSIIVLLTGAFYLIVPPMVEECVKLKSLLEIYFSEGGKFTSIPKDLTEFLHDNVNWQWVQEKLNSENFVDALKSVLPKMWSLLSTSYNIVLTIFTLFIVLLYLFFILLDYEEIAEGWVTLLPAKHRGMVMGVIEDIKDSMNKYFRGQSLVAFCVGILFSIGFLIIDFPLAIGLGMFIGLLNMVPYLQIIGFVPTVILALLKAADTGESFWVILGLALLVFCVVQAIQDMYIVPKVMGKITGLNPAIILLSLSVWGSLMGMLGMIIALPCTTLLLSYYQRYIKNNDLIYMQGKDKSSEDITE
ncbi:AI-2E family transporter [uncultured Bacteroides sp.]|uniref:AI-2E family transporter n=1 Tax=uncultured Bacteroides sp. TaxID=162156 RepID=UPI0026173F76|nr:AI-2E family transporter [uncultured Bacteroides sp.]